MSQNTQAKVLSTPDPVDVHVGQRLRAERKRLGMTQTTLADMVGVTFQQIQKYERGANRICASRLYEFSRILDVPISFFFDEMPGQLKAQDESYTTGLQELEGETADNDQFFSAEAIEQVEAYYEIKNPGVRKGLFELIKSISRSEQDNTPDPEDK